MSPGHLVTYTWDARGNLLSDDTFTYTYSAAGRMVRAASITATLVYTYTVDGLRVAQNVDGAVTTFTWDWATGVPEMLYDGQYTYLVGHDTLGWEGSHTPMGPVMWTYVLPDALGSVRQETNAAGAVTAVREWSPYGEEVGGAQAGLGFTGEWFDTSVGMTYLRARWYDGSVGSFTQRDTWPSDSRRPRMWNGYTYGYNNPVNLMDPSGNVPAPWEVGNPDKYSYSCNCGWIDWEHVKAGIGLMMGLLNHLEYAAVGADDVVTGFPPFLSYTLQDKWAFQMWMPNNPFGMPVALGSAFGLAVIPSQNLQSADDREQLAISILMDLEEQFEQVQGQTIGVSRFSEEDLPSDLIGFYIGLQMVNANSSDSSAYIERVRRMCDAMDGDATRQVYRYEPAYELPPYKYAPADGQNRLTRALVRGFILDWKNWYPRLASLTCCNVCSTARDCGACRCPGARIWPSEFSALATLRVLPRANEHWWWYQNPPVDGILLETTRPGIVYRLGRLTTPHQ